MLYEMATRPRAVRRRQLHGDPDPAHVQGAGAAARGRAARQHPRGARGHHPQVPVEEAGASLPVDARSCATSCSSSRRGWAVPDASRAVELAARSVDARASRRRSRARRCPRSSRSRACDRVAGRMYAAIAAPLAMVVAILRRELGRRRSRGERRRPPRRCRCAARAAGAALGRRPPSAPRRASRGTRREPGPSPGAARGRADHGARLSRTVGISGESPVSIDVPRGLARRRWRFAIRTTRPSCSSSTAPSRVEWSSSLEEQEAKKAHQEQALARRSDGDEARRRPSPAGRSDAGRGQVDRRTAVRRAVAEALSELDVLRRQLSATPTPRPRMACRRAVLELCERLPARRPCCLDRRRLACATRSWRSSTASDAGQLARQGLGHRHRRAPDAGHAALSPRDPDRHRARHGHRAPARQQQLEVTTLRGERATRRPSARSGRLRHDHRRGPGAPRLHGQRDRLRAA